MKKLKGRNSWFKVWEAIKKAYIKLTVLDELEIMAQQIRPRELKAGSTSRALEKAMKMMRPLKTIPEIRAVGEEAKALLSQVVLIRPGSRLRLALSGKYTFSLNHLPIFTLKSSSATWELK
jgi:hypothetical protein